MATSGKGGATTLRGAACEAGSRYNQDRLLAPQGERKSGMIDSYRHQFIPSAVPSPAPCLLLLHNTGGDENDLLTLGQTLDATQALLSPCGKVDENGMWRYFRRIAPGVFDLEDLRMRANELADWVNSAARVYGLDRGRITAVGVAHGANIASAMLLLRPEILSGAVLFRPKIPLIPKELPDLSLARVLVAGGKRDPVAPPEQTRGLAELLRKAGADVQVHWADAGHEIEEGDIQAARDWLLHPPRNV
jgi:predicted esterase